MAHKSHIRFRVEEVPLRQTANNTDVDAFTVLLKNRVSGILWKSKTTRTFGSPSDILD